MTDRSETVLLLAGKDEEETVYTRMLALELADAGFTVEIADTVPRKTDASVILASTGLPRPRDVTELSRREGIPLLRYGDGEADFLRPFDIARLIETVRQLISCQRESAPFGAEEMPGGGGLVIGGADRFVSYGGVPVGLTEREFRLLSYLAQNRGCAVSREELLREVWEYGDSGETNVVDVYIRYLRQKIDERFDVRLITTVRGKGYMLRDK